MIVYSPYSEMVDDGNQPQVETQVDEQQKPGLGQKLPEAQELLSSTGTKAEVTVEVLLPQKVEAVTPPPDPLQLPADQEITPPPPVSHQIHTLTNEQLSQVQVVRALSPIAAAVSAAQIPVVPVTELPAGALQVQAISTSDLTSTDLTTTELPVNATQLPPNVVGSVVLPIQLTGNGTIQYINAETLEVSSTPPQQPKANKKDASGELSTY